MNPASLHVERELLHPFKGNFDGAFSNKDDSIPIVVKHDDTEASAPFQLDPKAAAKLPHDPYNRPQHVTFRQIVLQRLCYGSIRPVSARLCAGKRMNPCFGVSSLFLIEIVRSVSISELTHAAHDVHNMCILNVVIAARKAAGGTVKASLPAV
ncbi:hypothetical protein FI667_g5335, partial [Globisporangium splendens]